MNKKIFILFIIFIICLCLVACSLTGNSSNANETPNKKPSGSTIVIKPGDNEEEEENSTNEQETPAPPINNDNDNNNKEPETPTPPPVEETTYTITYIIGVVGLNTNNNPTSYTNLSENITLTDLNRNGYIFDGWYEDEEYQTKITVIEKGTNKDLTLFAKWTPRSDISYKVEHYKENLQGKYVLSETETNVGTMGEKVYANIKSYEGYQSNSSHKNYKDNDFVKYDGTLVLRIYYKICEYTVDITLINCTITEPAGHTSSSTYKYGSKIKFVATANENYIFSGNCSSSSYIITIDGTNKLTFEAIPLVSMSNVSNVSQQKQKNLYKNLYYRHPLFCNLFYSR